MCRLLPRGTETPFWTIFWAHVQQNSVGVRHTRTSGATCACLRRKSEGNLSLTVQLLHQVFASHAASQSLKPVATVCQVRRGEISIKQGFSGVGVSFAVWLSMPRLRIFRWYVGSGVTAKVVCRLPGQRWPVYSQHVIACASRHALFS